MSDPIVETPVRDKVLAAIQVAEVYLNLPSYLMVVPVAEIVETTELINHGAQALADSVQKLAQMQGEKAQQVKAILGLLKEHSACMNTGCDLSDEMERLLCE